MCSCDVLKGVVVGVDITLVQSLKQVQRFGRGDASTLGEPDEALLLLAYRQGRLLRLESQADTFERIGEHLPLVDRTQRNRHLPTGERVDQFVSQLDGTMDVLQRVRRFEEARESNQNGQTRLDVDADDRPVGAEGPATLLGAQAGDDDIEA